MVATKRGEALKIDDESQRIVTRMKRLARKAERTDGGGRTIGGTGFTVLRLTKSPMERLLSAPRPEIGREEVMAADELSRVIHALHMGLGFGQPKMERADKSHTGNEPPWFIDAYARYKAFGNHWSAMQKLGDHIWRIVFDAVWDERPFHILESELGLKHGAAKKALIAGLRDYAARAGWVDKPTAAKWMEEASKVFRRRRLIGAQLIDAIDEGGKISA